MALQSLNTYARDREHRVQQQPTDRFSSRENYRGDKPPEKRSDRGKNAWCYYLFPLLPGGNIVIARDIPGAFFHRHSKNMADRL